MLLDAAGIPTLCGGHCAGFNGHPPLGVNATFVVLCNYYEASRQEVFQWAPTLGGECYAQAEYEIANPLPVEFQSAPTLGGECYPIILCDGREYYANNWFQWAPTLGGECYVCSNWYSEPREAVKVSMGTHPWG